MKDLGELGNGTCGHVVKMLHEPSNTVIAVKVRGEGVKYSINLEMVLNF